MHKVEQYASRAYHGGWHGRCCGSLGVRARSTVRAANASACRDSSYMCPCGTCVDARCVASEHARHPPDPRLSPPPQLWPARRPAQTSPAKAPLPRGWQRVTTHPARPHAVVASVLPGSARIVAADRLHALPCISASCSPLPVNACAVEAEGDRGGARLVPAPADLAPRPPPPPAGAGEGAAKESGYESGGLSGQAVGRSVNVSLCRSSH